MAESFPSSIATNMLTEIDFLTSPEARLSSRVKKEITKIKRILRDVKDVILNAEAQQLQKHDVKDVLSKANAQAEEYQLQEELAKLSKLLHDAEDLLDELKYIVLARQVTKLNSVKYLLKIKLTRRSLDEMSDTIKSIYEQNKKEFRRVYSREMEMNHTLVRSCEVFGRDSDKEKLINILMEPNKEIGKVDVIPIVGIGGIGKTTLARRAYSDKRIDEHFDLKMWVCVPVDFDMIKLMKEAYSSATGQNHVELEADVLENRLLEELVGNKFLLVLDDVWNNNSDRWEKLKTLFTQQANGSKIVVTTRSVHVAKLTGTAPRNIDLKPLPQKDCMLLFEKSAFTEETKNANPELIEIGEKIVGKCGGNPLVVKTLGTLLYQNINMSDWSLIKDSVMSVQYQDRNSILSALKLSYDHLPSHLRRCLAYCALFPRGYCFNSDYLICDWMAHGLLATRTENEDLEDIGLQYLKELSFRCFFQEIIEDYGFNFTFKMHNLIYQIVAEVAQKDCKLVDLRILDGDVDVDALHLYFLGIGNGNKKIPFTSNNLRTIIIKSLQSEHAGDSFVHRWISSFKHLRQLCLSGLRFQVLPDSVSGLKHLRFLDLSWNLYLEKLSDAICGLLSLQTLRLLGCSALKKLPNNIQNMIRLRYLEITTQEGHLPRYGIECLSSLRSLWLYKCHNLESLPEGMHRLTHLRKLILQDCDNLKSLPEDIKHLKRLEYMRIEAFHNITTLPAWLSNLTSLQKLAIISCPKLSSLPNGMQNLTNLKELKIQKSHILSESCRLKPSNISHVPEIHLDPAFASSSWGSLILEILSVFSKWKNF